MWYDTFDDLEEEEIERIVTLPTAATTAAKVSSPFSIVTLLYLYHFVPLPITLKFD